MRSSDLIVTGRRRAGLSQDELAERMGRPQSTITRWETGQQHPPLESVIEALRACGLELTVGIARYDDSYDAQIARQLRLDPAERVKRLTPAWATEGFDPIGALAELAGQARFVVIGDVAGALRGSPVMLGARTLHVVPAETALGRIEQTARRLDAKPSAEGTAQTQRWTLPTGGELHVTPLPPGTRGYRDLARDAEIMQIAPSTSVRVASLLDLIRIAEASPDAGARASVPALWATLEMHRREAAETTPARTWQTASR
ncbi:MAG TPA: helix-turn-helix transcriptional regulator [Solirubrobacteraceae bacterium]|jgi:transcriptional regulator with XRE-family HTH domain|nr:helix-turn-helix transcriptional regulator [Solirubrobacteraceae bacterium]